jgi:Putative Zn-dependent protease, contains TPR repeats
MKQYAEAQKHYRKAIKLNPRNMEPWRLLTLIAIRTHGNLKSLRLEMSKVKPISGPGWEELAKAFMMAGDNKKALQCMNSSKACPQDVTVRGLVNTASVYLDLQQFEESEKLLKRAEKMTPSASKIKKLLSVVYLNTNRSAEAIKYMRLASYMEPKSTELLLDLSTVLMDFDLKESESVARKAVNLNPKSAFLLAHLSSVLSRRNKLEEAVKYAHMAEQFGPTNNPEIYHRLTCTQIYVRDFQAAKRTSEKAIACDPSNYISWFNLGVVCYHLDEPKLAQNALKRSLELNPKNCPSWTVLSYVLSELNDTKGSEEAFRKAVACAPNEQKKSELGHFRSATKSQKKATLRGILLPQLRTTDAPSSKL